LEFDKEGQTRFTGFDGQILSRRAIGKKWATADATHYQEW